MSVAKGQNLGGVFTVDDLMQRSHVDEDCGCWHWKQWCWPSGMPGVWVMHNGEKAKVSGRRAALILSGKLVRRGDKAYATENCYSADCVNPAHARIGRMRDVMKLAAARGVFDDPKHHAHLVISAKARSRLTEAKRLEVALDRSITANEAALKHGISQRMVNRIRAQLGRKTVASVFEWRG